MTNGDSTFILELGLQHELLCETSSVSHLEWSTAVLLLLNRSNLKHFQIKLRQCKLAVY